MAKSWSGMDPLAALEDDDDEEDEESESEEEGGDGGDESENGESGEEGEEATGKGKGKGKGKGGGVPSASAKASEHPDKKQKVAINYASLMSHGYQGGGSILYVPDTPQGGDTDYREWGQGGGAAGQLKRFVGGKVLDEEADTPEERATLREKTSQDSLQRSAAAALAFAESDRQRKQAMIEERKAMSFSQREKRKRDTGQASRGKSYVEEEKRQLRDSGVYSGFDA